MGQATYTLNRELFLERLHLPLDTSLLAVSMDHLGNVRVQLAHPSIQGQPGESLHVQPTIQATFQLVAGPPSPGEILAHVTEEANRARAQTRASEKAGPDSFALHLDPATGEVRGTGELPRPLQACAVGFRPPTSDGLVLPQGGSSTAPSRVLCPGCAVNVGALHKSGCRILMAPGIPLSRHVPGQGYVFEPSAVSGLDGPPDVVPPVSEWFCSSCQVGEVKRCPERHG